jgi:signal peptidase complex subunit 3
MHSSLVRLQNVFGFFTTVAFVVAALIAATDLITPRAPAGTLKATNVQVCVSPSRPLSPFPPFHTKPTG